MEQKQIRNFAIISHIDHGKSTLADRFLDLAGLISSKKMRPQFLDKMDLEREKGITIKLKPVRMEINFKGVDYIFNLVDTPGHVDFYYEVSRALAAVEGVILLVDATQGIQAQTLANLELAKKQGLVIIPAINKIDSPQARIEEAIEELATLLSIDKSDILKISAKLGTNFEQVLEAVIERIPPPQKDNLEKPFRALVFDSEYDSYKGVVAFVRVVDGKIRKGEKIKLYASQAEGEVKELGYFKPEFFPQEELAAGETGYITTGIKDPNKLRVGDTIMAQDFATEPLTGYQEPKPMVFASLYPENPDDFDLLKDAISKLKLSDPSFVSEPETKEFLGRGFRCGFLGTLHTEILSERLHREFGLNLVISTPSVVYKIYDQKDREIFIYSASDWPDPSQIKKMEEPWAFLEVVSPIKYMGPILEVLKTIDGNYIETKYFSGERIILVYEAPLREIIINLYDKIKNVSQGFASMNYKVLEYRGGDFVKLEILIAGEREEAFSKIVPKTKAFQEGKNLVVKLKQNLPTQQFSVALQATVGGKIIARETIKSARKDVTGYLYGGDYTRKRKLLEKQKKGKKELKEKGRVRVPPNVFLEIFRT